MLNLCADQFRKAKIFWTCNFCYNSAATSSGADFVGAVAEAISAKFAPI